MSNQCAWIDDPEIGLWFLPGCMGAAACGEDYCTCPEPPIMPAEATRLRRIEDQLDDIKRLLMYRGAPLQSVAAETEEPSPTPTQKGTGR